MKPTPPSMPPPDGFQSPLQAIMASRRPVDAGRLSVDDIVGILQEAIIRGAYGPGRSLRQDEIAHLLGVSKIPVREALRTLHANGFVDLHHHRGAVVNQLTLDRLREAFCLREMLEPELMHAAVPHLDAAALDALDALVDEMDGDVTAWQFSELNTRFHDMLYRPANRALSMQILGMLQGHIQRMSFMQLSLAGQNGSSNEEHRAIVAACRAGDADEARRLVAEHVAHVKLIVLNIYEQQQMAAHPGLRRLA